MKKPEEYALTLGAATKLAYPAQVYIVNQTLVDYQWKSVPEAVTLMSVSTINTLRPVAKIAVNESYTRLIPLMEVYPDKSSADAAVEAFTKLEILSVIQGIKDSIKVLEPLGFKITLEVPESWQTTQTPL